MKNMDPVMQLAKENDNLLWSRHFGNDTLFSGKFLFREIYNPWLFSVAKIDLLLAVSLQLIFPFLQRELFRTSIWLVQTLDRLYNIGIELSNSSGEGVSNQKASQMYLIHHHMPFMLHAFCSPFLRRMMFGHSL